ncbi:hypothetical protein E0Z10_g4252 [Xylaria hypoxylon]|uniref:F-box domain-containing protein n=1 Tax=Xylaria hypoxylon TaxID=37992 RepID=A0A4Z0Z7P5_9PEZI|nr:hypothetical protein E0Z10_g4252 [Xylaria hypoxylon]
MSKLDDIPVETLLEIYSNLPDIGTVLALGATCKWTQHILLNNEHPIARNRASLIIGDDNDAGIHLAFMAAESHRINCRSPDDVNQFCDTYFNNPQYRLRALSIMEELIPAITKFAYWAWRTTDFPAFGTPGEMTDTEAARIRRYSYILEVAYRLLKDLPSEPMYTDWTSESKYIKQFGVLTMPPSKSLVEIACKF